MPSIVNWEMESVFPSASESSVPSVSTLPDNAVFSGVLGVSLTTVGGSFTGVTVMFTFAVAVAGLGGEPSVTV